MHYVYYKKVFPKILGFGMGGIDMSRSEVIEQMERILWSHYPHPEFKCECVCAPECEDPKHKKTLPGSWANHVAELMLDAAKGF